MKVELVTNPVADADFRDEAEAYMADGADGPAGLQNHLRDRYPRAAVVRGIEERGYERWYVYREGNWIKSRARF